MDNNKSHYEEQYSKVIEYKYKTNTRYQRFLVECIEKYIKEKQMIRSLCDIGCGQGLNTFFFLKDFPEAEILGIDLSENGIKYANEHFGKNNGRIEFKCGNILTYNFPREKYDVVTAFELLEHIEDWKSIAHRICNLAGKYIIVSSPVGRMRDYEMKHGHYRNFKRGELEAFFDNNNFQTVKTYYAGFPFWSPITRDLLNLVPGDSTKAQENLSLIGKFASVLLYILFRYFSTKNHFGDQFLGLFKKK